MLNTAESSSEQPLQSPFVQKVEQRIWFGMDQKNILNQAFSIIPDNLRILRIVSLAIHIAVFIWLFLSGPALFATVWSFLGQIGAWGIVLNTTYLVLTFVFQNAGPYTLSWKFTYILGEICSAFAFLICPMFLIYLLPNMLLTQETGLAITDAALYLVIHVVCPIFIWGEIFFTYYIFPKQHLKCLFAVVFLYGFFNLFCSFVRGEPIYQAVDWKSLKSYLFLGLGFGLIVSGFLLGNLQYRWKMRKESKSIVTTLQLNEVSSPSKLSQYAPISYDF